MKLLKYICIILILILSHIMCIDVTYRYCDLKWLINQGGTSAPVYTAYFYSIPYIIGILLCIVVMKKKRH